MPIVVQYSGRVCLLGEHCDWAGGQSLTLPLPLSVRLAVEDLPAPQGPPLIRLRTAVHGELYDRSFPVEGAVDPEGGLLRYAPAAAAALAARGLQLRPCSVWVHATLPAGRGFSSSAAFLLAVLDGLSRHAGHPLEPELLAELAYEVEHGLLGVPCGRLDPLACAAGAPAYVRWRADGRGELRRIQPRLPLHLVVAVLPRPQPAAPWLVALRAHRGDDLRAPADPEGVKAVAEALSTFADTAEAGAHALRTGDLRSLGAAMNRAQRAYEGAAQCVPALAAPRVSAAAARLRDEINVLGVKFSGAGGDRSLVALCEDPEQSSQAQALLEAAGMKAWPLVVERT